MSTPFLKIENLRKTFGKGRSAVKAVDNISFSAKAGEIILIMGPSGSGKTTLLMMMGALLTPDDGKIYYGEKEITSLRKKKLPEVRSKDVGFIFQSFNLLQALNVWKNVAVVSELIGVGGVKAEKQAKDILSKFGLRDRLNYTVKDLSGGEKQRVSVARALVTNPKILLADEPTANLDSKSGRRVMEVLHKIAKEESKIVIIVSHDMRIMDIADRVLWLEDGKIKEGKEEFVTDPACEMPLQQRLAPFHLKKNNQTYYFCSEKCLKEFQDTSPHTPSKRS